MSDYQTDDDRCYKRNIDARSVWLGVAIGMAISLATVLLIKGVI